MSGSVAVVTDSTCDVDGSLADAGVRVVALRVSVGDRDGIDGVEVLAGDVTRALREKARVTTSRPAPAEFAAVYRSLLDSGAPNVVSVHLSAKLSGTWESARLAAEDFPYGAVRVVDSQSTGSALGFAVLAAAAAARDGASAAEVQGAAVATIDRTSTLFYVDSLEFLRRGGRIGAAGALLATSLSIKPLLHLGNGEILPLEKVRTSSKALARLLTLTVEAAGPAPASIGVHHLAAADRALALRDQLRARIPGIREIMLSEVGAVVGAHLGPGTVATVVVRH